MLTLCKRRIKIRLETPLTTRDRPELNPQRRRDRSCRRHLSCRLIRCKPRALAESLGAAEAPLLLRKDPHR